MAEADESSQQSSGDVEGELDHCDDISSVPHVESWVVHLGGVCTAMSERAGRNPVPLVPVQAMFPHRAFAMSCDEYINDEASSQNGRIDQLGYTRPEAAGTWFAKSVARSGECSVHLEDR
jgi:hypothetical protein